MKQIKVSEAQKALQAIAVQKGRAGFDRAKSAYLDGVLVTDDEGNPVENLDIEVTFADPVAAEKAADAPAANAGVDIIKTIREEVAKIGKAVQRGVVIEAGGIDTRKAIKRGSTQFIKSSGNREKDAETAYSIGRWIQAATWGNRAPGAIEYCRNKGWGFEQGSFDDSGRFVQKAITGHSESVNVDGGFLVPDEFENEVLWLREQYGVVRNSARRVTMTSDTKSMPRKTGSHTVAYVGEGATNSKTKMAFDRYMLVAKKLRADGALTSELSEDAAINLGDEAVRDISEAFAKKEDTDAFLGDGTSTYGGIVGYVNKFLNLNGTLANIAGLFDAGQASYSAVTLSDILLWMAKLPAYADNPNTKFFCHKVFYHTVLERLAASAGGVTMAEIKDGGRLVHRFMGYPVEFVQALPSSPTANVPDAFFGDMTKSADFGDRRGFTFQTTTEGGDAWENDEVAYKATQRWDFNVHDVGNASATAADRVAGPIVAIVAT